MANSQAKRILAWGCGSITSLRLVSTVDWNRAVERVSLMEQVLQRDPAGVYGRMNFGSRDRYRQAVEELAEPSGDPTPVTGLPPFQGGIAGLFGYGMGSEFERVPDPRHDEFRCPDVFVGCYDRYVLQRTQPARKRASQESTCILGYDQPNADCLAAGWCGKEFATWRHLYPRNRQVRIGRRANEKACAWRTDRC